MRVAPGVRTENGDRFCARFQIALAQGHSEDGRATFYESRSVRRVGSPREARDEQSMLVPVVEVSQAGQRPIHIREINDLPEIRRESLPAIILYFFERLMPLDDCNEASVESVQGLGISVAKFVGSAGDRELGVLPGTSLAAPYGLVSGVIERGAKVVDDVACDCADACGDFRSVDDVHNEAISVFVVRSFRNDAFTYRVEGWPERGFEFLAMLIRPTELDKAAVEGGHIRRRHGGNHD